MFADLMMKPETVSRVSSSLITWQPKVSNINNIAFNTPELITDTNKDISNTTNSKLIENRSDNGEKSQEVKSFGRNKK